MFKKFSLWSAAGLFTFSVFCFITIGSLSVLVRPNYLKSWGQHSGAYQKLPDILVDQAAKESAKENKEQGSGELSFSDKGVQDAAKAALTPAFVQKSAEQVIDGSFAWLDEKSPKPTFDIDLLAVKQSFVDNLGVYLKERYLALPACAAGAMPASTDLLKIDCRPSDDILDIDKAVDDQKLSMLSSKDFLPETTISADTIGDEGISKDSIFDKTVIPTSYGILRLAPVIFGGLALLSGLLVVVLCEVKKFGVRKLGWRFIVAGTLALLGTIVGIVALTKVRGLAMGQGADSGIAPFKDIVAGLINAARSDILKLSGILGLASIVLGGIILVLTRSVSRKARAASTKEVAPHKTDSPEGTSDKSPKEDQSKASKEHAPAEPASAPEVPATPKPRAPKRTLIQ